MRLTMQVFTGACLMIMVTGEVLQAGNHAFLSLEERQRRLQGASGMAARHPNEVPHRDVDPSNTYNPMPEGYSSKCSGNYDGFFGMAASETRYLVKYQYGLETPPDTDISGVLFAVDKTIEGLLLNTFFPSICTDDKTAPLTGVSGFRFDRSDDPVVGMCNAMVPNAICNIHEGTVEVSGAERDIPGSIERHLGKEDIHEIHHKIVRLFPVHVSSQTITTEGDGVPDGAAETNSSNNLTGGAIAGIVISTLVLVGSLIGLYVFDRRKRQVKEYTRASGESSFSTSSSILDGELALDRALEEALGEGPFETIDLNGSTSMVVENVGPTSLIVPDGRVPMDDYEL